MFTFFLPKHKFTYHHKKILVYFLLVSFFFPFLSCGCTRDEKPVKVKDMTFTLISGTDVPTELQSLVNKEKNKAFELTYSDQKYLYVAKGYGKKPTGGYSIVITDFYEAHSELVFSSELYGPKTGEVPADGKPSYPYVIVKLPYEKKQVAFY